MTDELLSQSDIDALLSKFAPPPSQKMVAGKGDATGGQPSQSAGTRGAGNPRTSADVRPFEQRPPPSPAQPVAQSFKTQVFNSDGGDAASKKMNDLANRLAAAEAEVKRLGSLEARVKELSDLLANVSAGLQGTPGYGVKHTFVCDKCQAKGTVGIAYTCTACGKQTWRGWWPKK